MLNSTFIDCLESHKDGNRHVRRALAFPVSYIASGSLCAVGHRRFLRAVQSTHGASFLGQINYGLEIAHVSGLSFAFQLTSNAGGHKSHDTQASTCFRLGSSKSWLRHACFEDNRKIARKLLICHLAVVLGLTLHIYRHSLARAMVFFLPRKLRPRCLLHYKLEDVGNHLKQVPYASCKT